MKHGSGKALAPILFIVGLIAGLALATVPRLMGIDPLKSMVPNAPAAANADGKTDDKDKDAPGATAVHPKEIELRRMIADVSKQRTALEEREKPLALREAKLEEEKKALEDLKKQIDENEGKFKKEVVEVKADEFKNTKKLAKIWASMDPTEVVKVASGMDIELVAKILATMSEKQAALILGTLAAAPETSKITPELVVKLKQIKPPAPPAPEAN